MRLLDTKNLTVVEVQSDTTPKYAILSHTWASEEVSFQDLQLLEKSRMGSMPFGSMASRIKDKGGYPKLKLSAELANKQGYRYIWVDTCCIDKTSSSELSEAINSMYRWYQDAGVCYAYLADVPPADVQSPFVEGSSFRRSRWFTRGWTLQELIAPKNVQFFANNWSLLGSKASGPFCSLLTTITGIHAPVLAGITPPSDISVSNRMEWAAYRQTTRVEDIAYCLMGLFEVNMPLLYGEGKRAFIRLQEEILKETDDQSLFMWRFQQPQQQEAQEQTGTAPEGDDALFGLLADSPNHFRFGFPCSVRPLPPMESKESIPWSMTNQGLRVNLYLRPMGTAQGDEYMALLDCSAWTEQDNDVCPGIVLKRLWGNQFARIHPDRFFGLDPPSEGDITHGEGYETIYVKQTPAYPRPELAVISDRRQVTHGAAITASELYQVTDVYPPHMYDAFTSVIKSANSQNSGVLAVIRFTSPSNALSSVDIGVGLLRTGGRWDPWCLLRSRKEEPLSTVYEQVLISMATVRSPDIYRESTGTIPCNLRLVDRERRGRRYIQLEVSGITEVESRDLPISKVMDIQLSRSRISRKPRSSAARPPEFEELIAPCTTADSLTMSILTSTTKLTTRVRVRLSESKTMQEWLMEKLVSIRIEGEKSYAMLMQTCREGNVEEMVRILTNKEADIESQTEAFDDFRPLHWAAALGHFGMVRELIKLGAQVESKTRSGLTAIHLATLIKSPGIVTLLFQKAREILPVVDEWGVENPKPINILRTQTDHTLETMVHFVAAYSPFLFEDHLMQTVLNDASSDYPSHYGRYSLTHRNYLDETPLHRAAATGNFSAAQAMIESYPAHVEVVDQFERSALFHAACGGNPDVIRIMVARGALVDLADTYGRSPLHAAVLCNNADAVRALVELGANANSPAGWPNLTPAHFAALYGFKDCLRALESVDANVNTPPDLERGTVGSAYFEPIHLAAANGHLACVEHLCEAGCETGRSASHYILLQSDELGQPRGRLVACNGQTPMEIAASLGHASIVEYLRIIADPPKLGT